MKRFTATIALLVAVSLALVFGIGPTAVGAGAPPGSGPGRTIAAAGAAYVPGELIVKFKPGKAAAALSASRRAAGVTAGESIAGTGAQLLRLGGDSIDDALASLRSSGLVEYASPNYIRHADFTPNDPYFNPPGERQWNLRSAADVDIHMTDAWDIQTGSSGVVVAVVDTGIAYENYSGYSQAPDLAATHFTAGYDFVNNDSHPDDDEGHGTHVAGTVAQSTNNGLGCAGVAFGCTLMPIKVLDNNGAGSDNTIAQGITYAADHGANVINLSLSGPTPGPVLQDAIDYATGKQVVVCGSSGNEDSSTVGYPAAYPNCIAVGATNSAAQRAAYSNYGSALDVVAPGGDGVDRNGDGVKDYVYQQTFLTTGNPSSGFAFKGMQGTSMACPHVAGVAALVKSRHTGWSAADIKSVIATTCRDLGTGGWDQYTGYGLIDAFASLQAARVITPHIASVTPDHGTVATTVAGVTVTGSDFTDPMRVLLERDNETAVAASGVTVSGSTSISCTFNLAGVQPGLWNLMVENNGLGHDTLAGGFMVDAANDHTWYLAEGSTGYGYEEFILLQNPGTAAAHAQITFMTPDGAASPYPVTVNAGSRTTVRVNDILPNTDVSAKITCDQDIICERSMYWGNRIEGTDSIGVEAPSYSWYLAEGTTAGGFDTYLLIQNPQSHSANVDVTYMTPSGPVPRARLTMAPNSRISIHVNADLPDSDVSIKVLASERVIAERSMYWDGQRGGHASIGTTSPCTRWYLAEGATSSPYDEWVLVQNPGIEAANVTLTYMTPQGAVPQPPMSVPAGSRVSVHVNAALPGRDVSVQAASDQGIVVERSMYFNTGNGKGGHNTIGVPQPRLQCFLAEGTTAWGFDEWVLVQNPNSTPANVGIDYMTSSGLRPRAGLVLPPNSRVSVHVNADVPGTDTSTRVYADVPIIAERAMYWNGGSAGHVSQGLMK